MCWNWKVSIVTFALISIVSYKLFTRGHVNDKFLAVWIYSYGFMQLFETFQWLGQTPNYEYLNIFGSFCAALLLYFHPLAVMIGMSVDSAYKSVINTNVFKLLLAASVFMAIFGIHRVSTAYINKTHTFISKPDTISKHMVWEFPTDYISTMVIILVTGVIFIAPKFLFLFVILLIYYLLPILVILLTMTVDEKNRLKNYAGSYWCWYVAMFSFLFLFLN